MIDFVSVVLGEISSFRSQLNIQRPEIPVFGSDGKVLETVTSDVPDHVGTFRACPFPFDPVVLNHKPIC